MAKDMVCKLCESSDEPEVGVMLVSDLTGSGQLPFAVGLNCMTDFLTGLLETFAQPEGITPPEPSELEEDFIGDDSEEPQEVLDEAEHQEAIDAVFAEPEDPTAILEPSGPSPVESSAPDTGNGKRKTSAKARTAAAKTTE